ncbi:WD40 repeat domain-containing protein [Streptomyces sp. SP18CS02]|uniref:WD40 repeat domain-containing protein n=1 Tax=Streptomyces sp. SP18CS02 TaxID=3002531 RepID=UPI003FCCC4C7
MGYPEPPSARTLEAVSRTIASVACSPDGSILVTAGGGGELRLWDVTTHRRLTTLTDHTGVVVSVAVSPDGQTLATTGDDRTVRLWDIDTHQQLALYTGHTGGVQSAIFAPDGDALATTSSADGTVRPTRRNGTATYLTESRTTGSAPEPCPKPRRASARQPLAGFAGLRHEHLRYGYGLARGGDSDTPAHGQKRMVPARWGQWPEGRRAARRAARSC